MTESRPLSARRYLAARNWNLEKAKSMLLETLEWRVKFQADSITGASVYENGKTGKVFVSGMDLLGRPILYMRPGTYVIDLNTT